MYTLQEFLVNGHKHSKETEAVKDLAIYINKCESPLKVVTQRKYVDLTFYNKTNIVCYCEAKWVKDFNVYRSDFYINAFAELIWRCCINNVFPPVLCVITHKGAKIIQTLNIEKEINSIKELYNQNKNLTPRKIYDELNHTWGKTPSNISLEIYSILQKTIINKENDIFIPFNTSIEDIVSEINKLFN